MRWNFLKRSYPLRAFFIIINLVVLAMPILGIAALRIFENVLHRQTEAKLIAEGAYVQSLYLEALSEAMDGTTLTSWTEPLIRRVKEAPPQVDDYYRPIFPRIDLTRDEILPPGGEGKDAGPRAYPAALTAGHKIEPLLRQVQRYNLSGVRVLDANGIVVSSTGSQKGEDLSDRHEVKEALAGRYCSVLRLREDSPDQGLVGSLSRASKVRVYVAIPIVEDYKLAGIVYLHRTSLTFFRDLWEPRFATTLISIILITIAISLLLSYIVTRPLKSMINQAERIAAGESGVSLAVRDPAPTEAHQLSQALSLMLQTLKARLDYVEEFTSNVSHEFKTPITSIQGAIELLREGWEDMTDLERTRFLDMINSDVKRMQRLVKRLIELARIELAAPSQARTDLAQLLAHLVHRYAETGNNVELVTKTEKTGALIAADMAEIMFVNLIDNAITHGGGSAVTVTLEDGPRVSVSDRGPGISEGNLPRIFDRFFTTAREKGGTGLGLSMVAAIARAYGSDLAIGSSEHGTVFTVTLKPVTDEVEKNEE